MSTDYVVHPQLPLTRTREDGSVEGVLFWMIDGDAYVHPERVEMFKQHLLEVGIDVREVKKHRERSTMFAPMPFLKHEAEITGERRDSYPALDSTLLGGSDSESIKGT